MISETAILQNGCFAIELVDLFDPTLN